VDQQEHIQVQWPAEIHDRLVARAQQQGVTVEQLIESTLERHLELHPSDGREILKVAHRNSAPEKIKDWA